MNFTRDKVCGPRIRFPTRYRALLSALMALLLVPAADAKCIFSLVKVDGQARNLPEAPATIIVTLHTPKGDYTKEGDVSDSRFSLSAPFDTYSSSGFFGGDRCKNRPKTVHLAIRAGQQLLVEKNLEFSDAFERVPGNNSVYRLKREIEINAAASKDRGAAPRRTGQPRHSRNWRNG